MTRRWTCSLLAPLACCMALAAVLPSSTALAGEEPASESQRQARALLASMANHLAHLKDFTVTMHADYDVVQSTGRKSSSERRAVSRWRVPISYASRRSRATVGSTWPCSMVAT